MKIKVIELGNLLDELFEDYKEYGYEGESFSSFIETSSEETDDSPKVFDWKYVDEENLIEVDEDYDEQDDFERLVSKKVRQIKGKK